MQRYEYKVVPAPDRCRRIKGVRKVEARFAMTVEQVINENAAEGWDYVRADTLPCEHRGWFRTRTDDRTMLVFRRDREAVPRTAAVTEAPMPRLASAAERAGHRRVTPPSIRPAETPPEAD